jgi:hypothetical protein
MSLKQYSHLHILKAMWAKIHKSILTLKKVKETIKARENPVLRQTNQN